MRTIEAAMLAVMMFILPGQAAAQVQTNAIVGSVTATGANTCATAGSCVILQIPPGASAVSVVVSGTYSATLQFEQSADNRSTFTSATGTPQPPAATVTSTTSTGTWVFAVAGMTHMQVRASAYTSGTAQISMTAVPASPYGNTAAIPPSPSASAIGIAPLASSAVESGHVLKASAGNLYTVIATTTVSGLLMVFNSTTVPGDGAVTPIYCVPIVVSSGIGTVGLDVGSGPPSVFSTGISVAFSTGTNCASKTASATAFFTWRVQ